MRMDVACHGKGMGTLIMLSIEEHISPPLSPPCTTVLSDKGAKISEAYGSALDIPFLGRFSNRQTYIISPVRG